MRSTTISPAAVAKIDTLDKLLQHSYQMSKRLVKAMELEQCKKLCAELKARIEHVYKQVGGYGDGGVGPKDFNALMGGLKKLEIVYGYFFDRINTTEFMEVR